MLMGAGGAGGVCPAGGPTFPATGDTNPADGATWERELWVLCCDNTVLCDLSEPGDRTWKIK